MARTRTVGARVGVMGVVVTAAAVGLAACGSSSSSSASNSSSSSSAASGASASSSSSSSGGSAASGSTIKIGNVGNYSGFAADVSKTTELALEAWAADTNAKGGINGHQVQIFFKDDAGSPSKSLLAVKDLVQKDHVIALVSNHEAGVDGAWASYVSAEHIPVVGGVATGVSYSTDPNFFPTTDTGVTGGSAYTNAAKIFGKTSVSVAYCAEVPACAQASGLMQKFTAQLGLKYVKGQPISASSTSYAAQCAKYKDGGAQAVFAATDLTTAGRLVAQCTQQDYSPLFIDNPENWETSQLSNSVWNNLVFASPEPLWYGNGPGTADFLAAMNKYQPSALLNASTTSGWYSGQVFAQAIEKSGDTGAVTSQTVYDGLYKLGPNFDLGGVLSPVTYAKGKVAVQQYCAWYGQVQGGKLTAPKGANKICLSGS